MEDCRGSTLGIISKKPDLIHRGLFVQIFKYLVSEVVQRRECLSLSVHAHYFTIREVVWVLPC